MVIQNLFVQTYIFNFIDFREQLIHNNKNKMNYEINNIVNWYITGFPSA